MAASSVRDRAFSTGFESSLLIDWELDSIKTDQDEMVSRSLINYRHLKAELRSQCESLSAQQESLDEERDDMDEKCSEEQALTVWVMGSWGALETVDGMSDQAKEYSERKTELAKKILMLKIQVVCLKLVRVSSCIRQLQEILPGMGPKMLTPTQLQFYKFDEWCQSNHQIYELQSKILDLEAAKVRLHKEFCVREDKESSMTSAATKHSFTSHLDTQLQLGQELMNKRLEEMEVSNSSLVTLGVLDRIFDVSHRNTHFESCKLKSYIRECWDVQQIDDEFPTGVHPDRYLEFVGGLCQYTSDKQSTQPNQNLSYDTIYTKLEQHLMPAIHSLIIQHIRKPEEDARLTQLCSNLSHVTQAQFGITPDYQDSSVAPYYSAITKLKSISTVLTPTRKIYNLVQGALLVFEKLNNLLEDGNHQPPGADEFMDVWVYVILKANIPNLPTMVAYLRRYSNPNLAFSEAGYYLASMEFACQYLLRLDEHDFIFKSPLTSGHLLVCEQEKFEKLASPRGSTCWTVVAKDRWLSGFRLCAVKEWLTNPVRLYSTVLIPTTDSSASVQVSVLQVNAQHCAPAQIQFLEETFLRPRGVNGLTCVLTSLGFAVTLEPSAVDQALTLVSIPDGQYDLHRADIMSYCTLQRLGCIQDVPAEKMNEPGTESLVNAGHAAAATFELSSELDQSHISSIKLETITEAVSDSYQRLSAMYEIEDASNSLLRLMKVLTALLQNLDYLSTLPDFDGVYCDLIRTAVLHFQRDYNSKGPHIKLPETGQLCPNTWGALHKTINKLLESLHRLGLWFTGDPFSPLSAEQEGFHRFITSCQKSLCVPLGVYGTLGKKTRDEIENCVKGLTTNWEV